MPTESELDELEQETDEDDDTVRRLRSALRAEKARGKELSKQAQSGQEAARKLASYDAKLPQNPQVDFFLKHYDGEWTAEAIRVAAASYGFIEPDTQVANEVATIQGISEAASGSTPQPAPGGDDARLAEIRALNGHMQDGQDIGSAIEAINRRYGVQTGRDE